MKTNAVDEDVDRAPESVALLPWLKTAIESTVTRARQLTLSAEARDRLNAGLNSAKLHLKNHRFAEASITLEALDREYPNTRTVQLMLRQAREQLQGSETSAEIERLLREARGKKAFGRFEPALHLVQRALDLDSSNQSALSLQRTLLAEQQRDRDRKTIAAELQRYHALMKQGKKEAALPVLEELAAAYPWDSRVSEARRGIQRETSNGITKEPIKGLGRETKDQLLLKQERPIPAELTHWAEQSIARVPEVRETNRSRGPFLLVGGIGVLAAAVVVAAIVRLPPRSPVPISVQPAELEFFYARGDPAPMPASLQIRAGRQDQRWTTSSSDPWLQLSKAYGVGTSDVEAIVDPSTLSPGDHESIATVHSASVQQTLIVRLHIVEPLQPTRPPPDSAPGDIRIEPAKLEFSYVRTKTPPPPQQFRILMNPAGEHWTATAEETWLAPSRQAGGGSSGIDVTVDPSRMTAGDHTGTVKVASAAGEKVLKVLLHVTEPELRFDPPVNCHDDRYNGRYTGTITWLGPLGDGEVLTINNKNVASIGMATGRELPGCPVSITSTPTLDIQEPSAASNYRQIRFVNKSGHAIDSIKITWNVKK